MCRMLLRTCRVPGKREDIKWKFCKKAFSVFRSPMIFVIFKMSPRTGKRLPVASAYSPSCSNL